MKGQFKFARHHRAQLRHAANSATQRRRGKGVRTMFDGEILETGVGAEPADAESCFARALMFASGREVALDMIEAHKWFNIAASRGHAESAQMRREVAAQMSDAELGRGQRCAARGLE